VTNDDLAQIIASPADEVPYTRAMPVIVVGADTPLGEAVVAALLPRNGEVRAFVTDPAAAAVLRERRVKVALGDVSDGSHVASAALNAFSAVILSGAATDGRERSFAATPDEVVAAWAEGLGDAGITRVIWVDDAGVVPDRIRAAAAQAAAVATGGRRPEEIAAEIAALDAAANL
jgi:putative NADH-flavin reductase